jgi:1,2-phenylacetyl-CoA epoxidase PaaB subunit
MTKRERYTAHQRRYEQTEKGRACKRRYNAKRIWIHKRKTVMASTAEEAQAINAYLATRREGYVTQQRQQARAQA